MLGIDQSLTHTGLVMMDFNLKVKAWTAPKSTPSWCDEERIAWMVTHMLDIFEQVGRPNLAVIEGYSTGPRSQRKTLTRLGELGGVFKHWLWAYEIPFVECAPTALKAHATGFSDASKSQMIRAATRRWSECPADDNVADAFCLAWYGVDNYVQLVVE